VHWVGPGRGRKSTGPGANGTVERTPFEFLDRLADLVPLPRKHRHRYREMTAKPRSHDTSRIAWAKLMARVGQEFPFACPGCGGDIRLIAFITEPVPIRKVLTHLGERLNSPPAPAPLSRLDSTASPEIFSVIITLVPEPSTYAMALAGLACGGFVVFRRRKRA
jgi:hypothetical protein